MVTALVFGGDGDDELAFREGSISCGSGLDVVFDHSNTRHGRLVTPRAANELGYLHRDCETFSPRDVYPWLGSLPAYPKRLRPSWVGYRISCGRNTYDAVVPCSGVVRLTEATGRHRLLGSRAFPRGPWTGRMVRVRLT